MHYLPVEEVFDDWWGLSPPDLQPIYDTISIASIELNDNVHSKNEL